MASLNIFFFSNPICQRTLSTFILWIDDTKVNIIIETTKKNYFFLLDIFLVFYE